MSSRRLPGKILTEVNGKPLLGYLTERLVQCRKLSGIAVLTSDEADDDPVVDWCRQQALTVFRGSLNDVLARFTGVAERLGETAFVRVNGDSPLLDPSVVDRGVEEFAAHAVDLVTNVFPRSYPKGQSVEVVSLAALQRSAACMISAEDREHVTRFIYNHHKDFRIHNFSSGLDLGDLQMSVDTQDDLEMFRQVIGRMTRPHLEYGLNDLMLLFGYRV